MTNKLFLVDGSSYIFRAYYGVRPGLTSPSGLPTNAVVGFKNMLLSLLTQFTPSHLVMVFDTPGPCFRNELFPDYKANRDAPPEDLGLQFEPIFRLCEALNLTILKENHYEADDLIGSLAVKFSKEIETVIVSGDKDLAQLVNDEVKMYDGMKEVLYDSAMVKEKWGVPPALMAQYLALVGDASDNIPGAHGIGPKTAVKLFDEFEDLAGIYQNLEKIKGKVKENLADSKANVDLSLKLTEVVLDLPIDLDLEQLRLRAPHYPELQAFYQEMGFRPDRFLEGADAVSVTAPTKDDWDYGRYRLITDRTAFDQVLKELAQVERAAFDFETTGLDPLVAQVVGLSLAWLGGDPVYIPTAHQTDHPQLSTKEVLDALAPLFNDPKREWLAQNAKYELMILAAQGRRLEAKLGDSMIQSYLLDAGSHRHGLDELSRQHLGHEMIHFEDLCGKGKNQILFSQVPLDQALRYAAEDAEAALLLYEKFEPQLAEKGLKALYQKIEIPLLRCLAEMECQGVLVDKDRLKEIQTGIEQGLTQLEEAIYKEAGERFNLNSTQQLGEILFSPEKMAIGGAKKKTKTGYSTDASVLEQLAPEHKIAKLLLEYRSKTKLINTYLEPLPLLINPQTGRIHTSYMQTVAATGRLASKNPNLQNIPIKGEEGRQIRSAFVAPPGKVLASADYSQIELRFLAHLSADPGLIEVFKAGGDVHLQTAAAIYQLPPDLVTSEQRRAAKAINFGIIYGMGAFRLSSEIGVSNKEAKAFIDAYFARYPGIKSYMDETLDFVRSKGYVETLFGRRRGFDEINSKNHLARASAERAAINSRIQGSAADLIKLAMIDLKTVIDQGLLKAKMILQVHDELVFELAEEDYAQAGPLIKKIMENAATLTVPLVADIGQGPNWGLAH